MAYTNADGLNIRFGTERGEPYTQGEQMISHERELVVEISFDALPAITNGGNMEIPNIPAGAYITRGWLEVDEAWTTADAGTLTIGLAKADKSAYDADGIDAAIAGTALAANKVVKVDGACVGGTEKVTEKVWVYATVANTFTTGKATLVLYYAEV